MPFLTDEQMARVHAGVDAVRRRAGRPNTPLAPMAPIEARPGRPLGIPIMNTITTEQPTRARKRRNRRKRARARALAALQATPTPTESTHATFATT